MSFVKRFSATVASRFERVLSEIENHDAVIEASLNGMRKKVATAKVFLARVQEQERQLCQQIDEQTQQAELWRQRAIGVAKQDEAKALQCISRSRDCEQRRQSLQRSLETYRQSSASLLQEIEFSEQRLLELTQKLTLMRARHSSCEARVATSGKDCDAEHLLQDAFERWEINVAQMELGIEADLNQDVMEQEFTQHEQEQALRQALAELLTQEAKR